MGRNRVLSFMSQFSHRESRTPTPTSSPPTDTNSPPLKPESDDSFLYSQLPSHKILTPEPLPIVSKPSTPDNGEYVPSPINYSPAGSPNSRSRSRSNSRPLSMVQVYQPPLMDINEDTIPELQPIFTFLNSHANKLYQEGYFLKLDDQNTQGRPNPDRTWTECFAQLVGTVLSLWDAAELDAAGEDGEVLPKFINLTDASIKMIESLPTKSNDEQPLQNILSISTAGRNRYLLHFNSHHSLIQWTAGIRLSMFEHSTLQEAYTGALIAGKGKSLNNINLIMDRARQPVAEWVRVRFGAGVPWRRCWCVINPPDEKEYQKAMKEQKKKSPYDRSHVSVLKGDIRFYDSKKEGKKQKKAQPIASITDAYSCYAIYPQAKSLIDASTLIKIEGNITIHSLPPSSTEGFVFIMPEVPPAVIGFEMLLRFLFPTWDTFGLYGRPGRLVASVLDSRSLMFGMPKHKRYGYLEILDVTNAILGEGSSSWSEREWRKKLKELTGTRMNAMDSDSAKGHSRSGSRRSNRLSIGPGSNLVRPRVNFADDSPSTRTSRSMSLTRSGGRNDSAPLPVDRPRLLPAMASVNGHARNSSDTDIVGPPPPPHGMTSASPQAFTSKSGYKNELASTPERMSSEDERLDGPPPNLENMRRMETPEPVQPPPEFSHGQASRPAAASNYSPELRRAKSRLSSTTLAQLAKAGGVGPNSYPDESPISRPSGDESVGSYSGQSDFRVPPVHVHAANPVGIMANAKGSREAITSPAGRSPVFASTGLPPPMVVGSKRSKSPLRQDFGPPETPGTSPAGFNPGVPPVPTSETNESNYPQGHFSPAPNDPRYELRQDPSGFPGFDSQRPLPPAGPAGSYSSYSPAPAPPPHGTGGPPPPRHGTPPPHQRGLPPLQMMRTSPPRKPLPPRAGHLARQIEDGSLSPASSGSFTSSLAELVVDEHAFPKMNPPEPIVYHPPPPPMHLQRKVSLESRHDDASSTTSPDYASTRPSIDTQEELVDRPRAGVLRTVGEDEHDLAHRKPVHDEVDIPKIDFGPTINYGAQNIHKRNPSLPFSDSVGEVSPIKTQSPATNWRPQLGESTHIRQESEDTKRRSIAWQPGARAGSPSAERALSPEEYVQQRIAAASPYAHQRSPSGNTLATLRAGTPTPPLMKRTNSGDYLSQMGGSRRHSRGNSMDLLTPRPGTPGAASTLGMGSNEVSSHMSAREQEHIARVTGSPLINLAGSSRPQQPGAGLVGAIETRERERAQMKQGMSSQSVQYAINQRQQQQQHEYRQQQFQQQQAQMYGVQQNMGGIGMAMSGPPAPSMYGGSMGLQSMANFEPMNPGPMGTPMRAPAPPVYGPPQSHQPMSGPGMYGPGSPGSHGWSRPGFRTPSPGMAMSMGGQQQGFVPPPQGQYAPGPQQPGTPGSPHVMYPYQGQAF